LVRRLIDERSTEIYGRLKEDMDRRFAALEERLAQRNIDEKAIKSLVKAMVGNEIARVHSVVMEEFDRLKAKVEEELSKSGVDVETIRQIVDEVYNKLLDSVKQIVDQRVIHILDTLNEQTNSIRDALDLINEVHKVESEFEEELLKLRDEVRRYFNEEYLEELFYKTLVRRGILRRKRRKWVPLIAGLSVLGAIITGLLLSPAVTLVILAVAFAILLRW
jgi:DUF438 domain-containing protein